MDSVINDRLKTAGVNTTEMKMVQVVVSVVSIVLLVSAAATSAAPEDVLDRYGRKIPLGKPGPGGEEIILRAVDTQTFSNFYFSLATRPLISASDDDDSLAYVERKQAGDGVESLTSELYATPNAYGATVAIARDGDDERDEDVVRTEKAPVPLIFASDGDNRYRDEEVLRTAMTRPVPVIFASDGGRNEDVVRTETEPIPVIVASDGVEVETPTDDDGNKDSGAGDVAVLRTDTPVVMSMRQYPAHVYACLGGKIRLVPWVAEQGTRSPPNAGIYVRRAEGTSASAGKNLYYLHISRNPNVGVQFKTLPSFTPTALFCAASEKPTVVQFEVLLPGRRPPAPPMYNLSDL